MKFLPYRDRRGVTFVEIIVVIGILITLIGMASISFVPVRSGASLNTAITTLLADLKSQQIKAMVGDTEGTGANENYGIYFEQNKYTLFRGSGYSPSDPSNFSVVIDEQVEISGILFPSSSIIFSIGNGDVIGFSSGQNSITLRDTTSGQQKTIIINRYGVITSVN